jgi:hypothetical protein
MTILSRLWSAILAALSRVDSAGRQRRRAARVNVVAVYFALQDRRLTRAEAVAIVDGLVEAPEWALRGAVTR